MKKRVLVYLCCLFACSKAFGITSISVSGNPGPMIIKDAIAGAQPTSVTDSSTTWTVQADQSEGRLIVYLSSNMPPGMTLSLATASPNGGWTKPVPLSTLPQTILPSFYAPKPTTQGLAYTLAATAGAGIVSTSSVIVTFVLASVCNPDLPSEQCSCNIALSNTAVDQN